MRDTQKCRVRSIDCSRCPVIAAWAYEGLPLNWTTVDDKPVCPACSRGRTLEDIVTGEKFHRHAIKETYGLRSETDEEMCIRIKKTLGIK